MSIHVALTHRSHYLYDRPVNQSPHVIRLRPAPHCRTPILSYSLRVKPEKHFLNWHQDPFSNYLARLVFLEKSSELLVEVDLVAEMAIYNPFDFFMEPGFEMWPFKYETSLAKQLAPFLEIGQHGPLFQKLLAAVPKSSPSTIDFVVALNQQIAREITYLIRLEPGVQTPEESCQLKSGSCRDTAWLLVQICRSIGLAARFVSGYLIQLAPDVKSLDGPSGTDRDFTDLHAWCEVYLPGGGWIGLDPTSGLLAGEGHIPLACSAFPSDAAAIFGATDKCETVFKHEMRVQRIFESPRVTRPYSDEQWSEIEKLGHSIDDQLKRGDVRLTMGGEPTFISIDNMDGAEWNFTAVSPEKRKLSANLLHRLKNKWAPGSLLHFGQGKWYPGESLPRWSLGCYWRTDGLPLWNHESLFADDTKNYGHGSEEAKRFITKLSQVLGVKQKHIIPAYEDTYYYLWREQSLPANVDPLASKLDSPEERDRLRKTFDQGLSQVVGYVLPVYPGPAAPRGWTSGPWFFRSPHLFLIPGDSPIGLRLPLDTLPWVSKSDYPYVHPIDPFDPAYVAPIKTIIPPIGIPAKPRAESKGDAERVPQAGESADWIARTAVCVEARSGRLHVFMPPTREPADYLQLLSAVEETASALQLPVVIEGAAPPDGGWLKHFKITPDPGVIEVNLQPAHSWEELVNHTNDLYDEARLARLGSEKFMIDGRHVGTGGGNHIIVGGATPADSPILRRPDLLRSLLCFWQNHPSLSFLFSGLFIGPTSQHPRVDEARNDSLYELELAFRQVPVNKQVAPWLVDRLFRHLLIDITGNTHRAEFCIDKLYSPDSSSGRLGLLELRAFEMPPHARMSLTQQLLLRALIARFWDEPYEQNLVRWGTQLHDRFLLPHFVEQDFRDVILDLREHGFPFQQEWFAPHFEFRFPRYGGVVEHGIDLEIRQALEPWHVLGEQGAAGGTVRYVDSSLDRLQVKVRGMTDSRHVILCNGHPVPLHPTGTHGEFAAGVRFRAWHPGECLHPTIGIQSPLTFDIADRWNSRSLGGCTFHTSHPGGRNHATLPVNAYEAESRRLERFSTLGHSSGRLIIPSIEINPEFPLTLDLRAT
ncbi:MAG: dehydrogenase [Verrucomicrobiales bacterium]|nr:dehydrogenase [Verrucomicrobiales bacterium]